MNQPLPFARSATPNIRGDGAFKFENTANALREVMITAQKQIERDNAIQDDVVERIEERYSNLISVYNEISAHSAHHDAVVPEDIRAEYESLVAEHRTITNFLQSQESTPTHD